MMKEEKIRNEIAGAEKKKEKVMNRKEAIKKTGYIALSTATMMLLISEPAKANGGSTSSPAAPPGW
jgi:hypothetical protein